jgi:hypothetical protein
LALNFQVQSGLLTFGCNFEERREDFRRERNAQAVSDKTIRVKSSGHPIKAIQ